MELPKILLNYKIEQIITEEPSIKRDSFPVSPQIMIDEEMVRPEIHEEESKEEETRDFDVGGLVPGNTYIKDNLKVSLERRQVNPNRARGGKNKEEVVAVLSEVNQNNLEKYMEK
jgi:hypothetical protein